MFSYDELSAEERIIKALTDKETGDCRIDNPEYASIAIKAAHAMDKETDTLLLKLYTLEQEIDNLETVISNYAYRRECLKIDPESDWRRTVARESERRMRAVVDKIAESRGVVLFGDKWVDEYNSFFGDED